MNTRYTTQWFRRTSIKRPEGLLVLPEMKTLKVGYDVSGSSIYLEGIIHDGSIKHKLIGEIYVEPMTGAMADYVLRSKARELANDPSALTDMIMKYVQNGNRFVSDKNKPEQSDFFGHVY